MGRMSRCTPSGTRRARALAAGGRDFVDFVDEDDARLLGPPQRLGR